MRAVTSANRTVEFGKSWEGQTVDGRFPLQRYLGGNATNAVFLTQHRTGKAAIKLVRLSGPEAESRLAQWRKASELSHPHLLRIFEVGRCWLAGNELVYILTECAEENLSEVLPRRALSVSETEQLLRPALDVLRFLHQRGLVHGRIRPSNVMSVSEQLKLSSDGIRPVGRAEPDTDSTIYDAPEARTGDFSSAADVWSLGVTVAEALIQRPPTNASDVRDLPQPFADIVGHCVQQNAIQRWTPKEILARLQGQIVPESVAAPPEPPSREARAGRGVQIGIAVVVLIGVAGIYGLMHRGSSPPQPTPTPAASTEAAPNSGGAPVASSASSSSAGASVPGAVLNRVLPSPSTSARNTIHGTIKVRVKVNVDGSGKVSNAKFLTVGPSKYFSRLSMEAARQWKFQPPVSNGRPVPSDWTLLFEFTRGGTQAIPQQSGP